MAFVIFSQNLPPYLRKFPDKLLLRRRFVLLPPNNLIERGRFSLIQILSEFEDLDGKTVACEI